MKSRKEKSMPALDIDLKSIIHQHSLFFDKLIELIPAKFYLPIEDQAKPWFQGLSKVAKASAKKETRENIKKARRARLDPEKSSTTLDLLKQSLENEKSSHQSNEESEKEAEIENPSLLKNEERSVTYEELRQRLHRRIEELRSNRHAGDSEKSRREIKREIHRGKRKLITETDEKKPTVSSPSTNIEKDVSEASEKLTFGHVKLGNEDERSKKKRKLSKMQELEKAKKLEEAKNDPESGEIISKKHSWNAATSRAAGIKVHDDPKLIRQSIKKEKKKHQKNVQKWNERIESRVKVRAEKQQTRSENISERIHQKKMRRIAKREKKLMRPGFEGRKEGFINES